MKIIENIVQEYSAILKLKKSLELKIDRTNIYKNVAFSALIYVGTFILMGYIFNLLNNLHYIYFFINGLIVSCFVIYRVSEEISIKINNDLEYNHYNAVIFTVLKLIHYILVINTMIFLTISGYQFSMYILIFNGILDLLILYIIIKIYNRLYYGSTGMLVDIIWGYIIALAIIFTIPIKSFVLDYAFSMLFFWILFALRKYPIRVKEDDVDNNHNYSIFSISSLLIVFIIISTNQLGEVLTSTERHEYLVLDITSEKVHEFTLFYEYIYFSDENYVYTRYKNENGTYIFNVYNYDFELLETLDVGMGLIKIYEDELYYYKQIANNTIPETKKSEVNSEYRYYDIYQFTDNNTFTKISEVIGMYPYFYMIDGVEYSYNKNLGDHTKDFIWKQVEDYKFEVIEYTDLGYEIIYKNEGVIIFNYNQTLYLIGNYVYYDIGGKHYEGTVNYQDGHFYLTSEQGGYNCNPQNFGIILDSNYDDKLIESECEIAVEETVNVVKKDVYNATYVSLHNGDYIERITYNSRKACEKSYNCDDLIDFKYKDGKILYQIDMENPEYYYIVNPDYYSLTIEITILLIICYCSIKIDVNHERRELYGL